MDEWLHNICGIMESTGLSDFWKLAKRSPVFWMFLLGIITYVIVKSVYTFIYNKRGDAVVEKESDSPDIKAEVKDDDDDENDEIGEFEDIDSALPSNLQHIPLKFKEISASESVRRSKEYYDCMNLRRTVRQFSTKPIPDEVLKNVIRTAGTAPSGAHTEPWTFVVVKDLVMKKQVRAIIEDEEEINYKKRMGKVWTTDLKPFRTNWIKEYLTDAPALILVFKQIYSFREDGKKKLHYYNEQSSSIAAGILLTAIHYAGLVSLTSTPLNCGPALRTLLGRPQNEKLTILLPVGYPSENCLVPDLNRKPLEEILVEF